MYREIRHNYGIIFMKNLTQKQLNFVMEYLNTGNCAEAYRRSYDCRTMNPKTARRKALEVFAVPKVREMIEAKQRQQLDGWADERNRTIRRLMDMADADFSDFMDFDGQTLCVKDLRTVPKHKLGAIRRIRYGPKGVTGVVLYDRLRVLQMLGDYLGMFDKKG